MAEPSPHVDVMDATLQELLAEQALVAWAGKGVLHHLGRLSEGNNAKAKLTLWMGCDGTKLLINFHLPVKTRPTEHKINKHMYLVVPAEHFRVTVDEVVSNETPDTTQSQLGRDGVSQSDILVRVHFALTEPAFVVMPVGSRGADRTLLGPARQLLLHLKSLSQTSEFVVYLKHRAYDKVQSVSATLSKGKSETPTLNLQTMYGRGCSGVKNAWEQYSCSESNAPTRAWNPLVDDNPPPYQEVAPVPSLGNGDDDVSIGWATHPKPHPVIKDASHIRARSSRGLKRKSSALVPPQDVLEDDFGGSTTDAFSTPSDITAHHHLADALTLENSAHSSLLCRNRTLNWALLGKPYLHIELQDFLVRAWKHDPIAHETYGPQLLTLGACVRDNDVARFDALMGECQASVVTAAHSGSPPMWEPTGLVEQVELVREWLNDKVCRNAGTLMLDLLVDLQGEAVAAKAAVGDVVGRERFYAKKATCLAAAFYVFGGRV